MTIKDKFNNFFNKLSETNKKLIEDAINSNKDSEVNLEFKSYSVKDSDTVLNISELVKGASIEVSSSNGSQPASGDYVLEDETKVSAKDGLITSIENQPKEEEPAKESDTQSEELAAESEIEPKTIDVNDAPATEDKEDLAKRVADLESMLNEILTMMKESVDAPVEESEFEKMTNEKFNAISTQLETVDKALKLINETPAQFSKVDNRIEYSDSKEEKYKRIAQLYSKK